MYCLNADLKLFATQPKYYPLWVLCGNPDDTSTFTMKSLNLFNKSQGV